MATSNEFDTRFVPRSTSDSIDGDNSQTGACTALTNLIFDPSTPGVLVCRPGVRQLNPFTGFQGPSVVSVGIQIDGIVYGLVASSRFPGFDEPFAFDISSGDFLTVSGVTANNVPASLPTAGDWIPPDIASSDTTIIITHDGFNFPAGNAFGGFDISEFTSTQTASVTNGSPVITGNPDITGVQIGYKLSDSLSAIPAGATVVNKSNFALTTTGTVAASSTAITSVGDVTGVQPGQAVAGIGIPVGTTVFSVVGNTVNISLASTISQAGVSIFFTGTSITMSANATGTHASDSITITGGTTNNPLWFAGNLAINPLPTQPTTVNTFTNRFYFGCGSALAWSDTLSLQASASNQAIFIGDSTPITAISPMSLSTTSQAVIDGLIIFKQNYMTQLTGDSAFNNLRNDLISDEIGTAAPRSIGLCPDGLRFMAVDGVRLIQLSGTLTDPDPNLALPFIYSIYPSRVSAAYNNNTYRICTQNGAPSVLGAPVQEYWLDLKRKGWTGPHTFEQDLALPYKSTFILFSNVFAPSIWESDVVQGNADSFLELGTTEYVAEDGVTLYVAEDGQTEYTTSNTGVVVDYVAEDGVTPYVTEDGLQNYITENIVGTPLEFLYQTVPMTDFSNTYANTLMNSTLDIALPSNGITYLFSALNEIYATICTAAITAPATAAIWGQFIWGLATWGAIAFGLQPRTIPWPIPIVFNRLSLSVSGNSSSGLKLGSFHLISKRLKFLLH